ncbi:hypothetical protein E4U43_001484 [Claviceps pusilla]|uniref:Uncharacterized protein n=1 Tax=Claviceps pusilla TaxID=123648 RepID=A0A9P7SZR3_9HYPO|nr:hypothetical protein E4U43_001484 [Claviceps pusilla]
MTIRHERRHARQQQRCTRPADAQKTNQEQKIRWLQFRSLVSIHQTGYSIPTQKHSTRRITTCTTATAAAGHDKEHNMQFHSQTHSGATSYPISRTLSPELRLHLMLMPAMSSASASHPLGR